MASNRSMSARGESLLGWTAPHNAVDNGLAGIFTDRASLRQSREASQWLYVLALLCLISLLAFLYLALASYVAREIEGTVTLEATIQSIKEENNKLRLAIVLKEDLTRIQQEAKAMGFVTPQHMEYLEVVLEESVSPTNTASSGQLSPTTGTLSAPGWWDRLVRQFREWTTDLPETGHHDSP